MKFLNNVLEVHMMTKDLQFVLLALFVFSFIVTGLVTPLFRKLAVHFHIWDSPNSSHKTHVEPVPYLGGLAIVFGVLVVVFLGLWFSGSSKSTYIILINCVIPAIFMSLIGLADDILNLSPWPRFVAQSIAGAATSWFLIQNKTKGVLFDSEIINVTVTVLWIVGLCNAVNFFDNIDGGAAGAIAISTASIALISLFTEQGYVGALASVVSGSCLGFLLWNKSPARIYMGDAGSLFLGVLVATLAIRIDTEVTNHGLALMIPFLILALPILDTTVVVISRISRGISPFRGGRDHLSHLIMARAFSKKVTILLLWGFSCFFAFLGVRIAVLPSSSINVHIAFIGIFSWLVLLSMFLIWPFRYQTKSQGLQ
jgi:UDP-GlcNAc:undecaprenyl-phosphate GlcNAc-1-phosphate transferase